MKIIDIQRFINKFKVLTEAVTLPQIRRGILGKDHEYPVIDSDEEWYETRKKEILSTIEKALNVDDKTLKNKLQKFDTWDYFTNDKPRKLKIKELLGAVRKNFISQVERSRNTEEKTSGIEAQYEMISTEEGVEIYAVYTPMANRHLTHSKLWVQGCYSPSWCIASSTANNYWNTYHLYEAEYPSVFIVAQKTGNRYETEKYELKCDPHKSISFKEGKITLDEWVDEWRDPEQNEKTYEETSLFDYIDISVEELEDAIRELVNSKKSEGFSKKFGREMLKLYTEKIKSGDENEKMEYLTKACRNGTFINFFEDCDKDDIDYFLDELIRYETLTEIEVKKMELTNNKKAISNLIKNKRCSYLSLGWAKQHFDDNMVKRVYYAIPEDVLILRHFEGVNVRKTILENIKHIGELKRSFVITLIKNDELDKNLLFYIKGDEELLTLCVQNMVKNNTVDYFVLDNVKHNKKLLTLCIQNLIENNKVYIGVLDYIDNDEELLTSCIHSLIKNNKVDGNILLYVEDNRELLTLCIQNLIKNNKEKSHILNYVKNDNELLSSCIRILVKTNTRG